MHCSPRFHRQTRQEQQQSSQQQYLLLSGQIKHGRFKTGAFLRDSPEGNNHILLRL
jgi:hypothetical protein